MEDTMPQPSYLAKLQLVQRLIKEAERQGYRIPSRDQLNRCSFFELERAYHSIKLNMPRSGNAPCRWPAYAVDKK